MTDRLQRRLVEIGAPADVHKLAAELAEMALRDPLTGLYNRRFFDTALTQHIETARRYGRELSLILFDLDRFKAVNDTCGHQAGDAVLKTFAMLLQKTARKADIVCRIGGDEFAVILPETGPSGIQKIINRFVKILEESGTIRAATGTSSLPSDLFAAADTALRAAKQSRLHLSKTEF